jgi:DNA adenine methylase
MKPPLTYYGGKQKLAKTINQLIPEHRIYVEPFFGGGAVFFAKNPSLLEVINDTNGELMNFYKVMKTKFTRLEKEISITLRSRDAYRKAKVIYHNPDMFDEIKRAWAVWTLANKTKDGSLKRIWNVWKRYR